MSAPSELDVGLNRELFLRILLRDLAGSLEDVVGLNEANGFIGLVGQRMGLRIAQLYCAALKVEVLPEGLLPEVLVDLKRRIEGDFYLIESTPEVMVFGNRACPFGEHVLHRPSLCMMTSNVFGVITAGVTGYAKVALESTIAGDASECRVVVYKRKTREADAAFGREYFNG